MAVRFAVLTFKKINMKKLFLLLSSVMLTCNTFAQAQLWGMTSGGGQYDSGTIFKTDGSGNSQTVEHSFLITEEGAFPLSTHLTQASDGKLYGMTSQGGTNNYGVIFQYDPATSIYTKKFDFNSLFNGINPKGSLMQASDGKLYGMTPGGGVYNKGVLFQYDPATSTYAKKLDFNGTVNGSSPQGSLIQGTDGKLYGMTGAGGTYSLGVLFQYDPATSIYTKKLDFNGAANGSNPNGSLMQASDGKLYGMTPQGGANSMGVLFQYDPATSTYTKKLDFNGAANGSYPYGSLIQATDGKLYGMTSGGGVNSVGVLFQYDPTTISYNKKFDFDGTVNGSSPLGSLMQASDGRLYGMTYDGGASNVGIIFQYDPATSTYTKKIDFNGNGANGLYPWGSLMQASDGKLYGMTNDGGVNNAGVLFQYDLTTSIYNKKIEFNGATNGRNPYGSLMQASDGKLYGMTKLGGTNNLGVIFQYDLATNTYIKKFDFDGTVNGSNPLGSLIQSSDGKLYGMTYQGGVANFGVLFQFDPATSTYTKKLDFNGTANGSNPQGSLMQASDGKLYGMTSQGGISNFGVIFQYDPATGTFTKKIDFNGTANGRNPYGSLMQASDGKLYGMTNQGGASNFGVIFQYDPVTSTYTGKLDFGGTYNGSYPYGSLMQASTGGFYGMTSSGGANNKGVLFQYNPNPAANIYKILDFNGATNGSSPNGSLMQASDGKLYGMTYQGGGADKGVLFQYDLTTYTKKLDFNGTNGLNPQFTNLIEVSSGISTGIQEQQFSNSFLIFPNPNSGNFIIETEAETLTTITNMLGETILTLQLQKGKNEINLNKQSNGIYFIKTGNLFFKLIKQ